MVVDDLWEDPKPKPCRVCGLVACECEDNDDER